MFHNRKEAGRLLAKKLDQFSSTSNTAVVGITRGGVVVSSQIAKELSLPHYCIVIKKIGAPYNLELALGAVGPKGVTYWDSSIVKNYHISAQQKKELKAQKQKEQEELQNLFPNPITKVDLHNKTVILVDDGVATGATVLAASRYFKKEKVALLILAVPVISKDTYEEIGTQFGQIVVLDIPREFRAVGQFYESFPQVENEEVIQLLKSK